MKVGWMVLKEGNNFSWCDLPASWILPCTGHIHPQLAQTQLAKALAAAAVAMLDSSAQAAQKAPRLFACPASSLLGV